MDPSMDSRTETSCTEPDAVIEFPVIEFPDHEFETVEHPFDAAERVLAAAS